jgi:signal transduction histidine kinase
VSSLRGMYDTSRILRGTSYSLLGLPISILWVIVFSPLLGVSLGLLVLGVGFMLFSIALRLAGAAAGVERWLLAEAFRIDVKRQPRNPTGTGFSSLVLDPLRDGTYWRELLFVYIRAIFGPAAAVIVITCWVFPITAISSIIWGWWVIDGWTVLLVMLGFLSIFVGPVLIAALTEVQIATAQLLLGPGQKILLERAETAQRTRDLSAEAAETERRRIERDLHDGAQARLATVAMDLGRAKRRLEKSGGDPEIESIIDAAHQDAKAAIVELRDLARGIHPAVLTDRGLDAALSDVVARCAVPVHLDVRLLRRPAAHIESAAYFAVSELVANISKHANAKNAWVTVRSTKTTLLIDVSDDGVGGVDPTIGSGVDGIHDRITSIDGTVAINSPLGGGTTVMLEVPLTESFDR